MNASRQALATQLGFREQFRRPLVLVLLVVIPLFFISRSIAITLPTPRTVGLPGGVTVATTMKDIHGAIMATITVAFLAGLLGVFVMQSALQADRRLVIAGFRPLEAIIPRLVVVVVATLIVVGVSLAVTAADFTPKSWAPFVVGTLAAGLIYAGLGAISGALLGRLGATYLMFFLPMIDIGILQNPMFGDGRADDWATLLPGYGPTRLTLDGAFSTMFHAGGDLVLSAAWVLAVAAAVGLILRRSVAPRR